MNTILIIIPYFGKFPEWSDLFFETLKRNCTIDFVFFTDCDTSNYNFPNVIFNKMTFKEYITLVNKKIDVVFNPANPYKICDIRPLFGEIHYDIIKNYDFFGWTDMDLLFGDIRSFYTDDILKKYNVLSTHKIRISGHFALFKNNYKNRNKYKYVYKWKEAIENPKFVGIDEHGITNAYTMTIFDKINEKFKLNISNFFTKRIKKIKIRKLYMVEQYTTPFVTIPWIDGSINSNQPKEWYYIDGKITNNRDGDRKFMYIHFMNFKSSQWRHDGTKAPWEGKKKICFASINDMKQGVLINENGISPL